MWIRVHAARTLAEAHLVAQTLRAGGIQVSLRGESRPSIAGEIPLPDAMVEVVVAPADEQEAREILADVEDAEDRPPWRCGFCREENPGHFRSCWSCGKEMIGEIARGG